MLILKNLNLKRTLVGACKAFSRLTKKSNPAHVFVNKKNILQNLIMKVSLINQSNSECIELSIQEVTVIGRGVFGVSNQLDIKDNFIIRRKNIFKHFTDR